MLVSRQCHFKLNSMCRSVSWLYEWICDVSILPWIEIYGAIWLFHKCASEWIQMIMWFVLVVNDSNFFDTSRDMLPSIHLRFEQYQVQSVP